jgi:hypothetical protein
LKHGDRSAPNPLAPLNSARLTGIAIAARGDWVRLTGADFSITFDECILTR